MNEKVKIALVGLGYWGPKLLDKFLSIPEAEVVWVCDNKAEALNSLPASYLGKKTESLDDILKDPEVKGVVVATPPETHFVVGKKVVAARKHLFVEKPFTVNSQEADELLVLATKEGVNIFVDHTFCFDEVIQELKKLVSEKYFGEIKGAKFDWLGARPKEKGPNVIWDSGPHAFSSLLFVLGANPLAISMKEVARLPGGVISAVSGEVSLDNGIAAKLMLAWKDQSIFGQPVPKAARITVVGSKRTVVYEGSFGMRKAVVQDGLLSSSVVQNSLLPVLEMGEGANLLPDLAYKDEPLSSACRAFLAVAGGRKDSSISDGAFGRIVVKLLVSSEESVKKQGAKIAVD